jgi:hypothetical protein
VREAPGPSVLRCKSREREKRVAVVVLGEGGSRDLGVLLAVVERTGDPAYHVDFSSNVVLQERMVLDFVSSVFCAKR